MKKTVGTLCGGLILQGFKGVNMSSNEMKYYVDRVKNGIRERLCGPVDMKEASRIIDADAQINGPDCAYYVDWEGDKNEPERTDY